jgi:glycosyltransferase involved in cell wall biosynthesis
MPAGDPLKISVVTPCLNAAATLPEALASVRGQDYPHVEHVVVDGGSTDGSVALLEGSDGVRWISEPDRGLSDAMNKGIAMATGDVIGWLNADDFYEPGTLTAVARAFAENPDAVWVTGRCRIVDGHGKEIRKAITAYKNLLLRNYSFRLYLTQNFISAPATFVRKEAYDEAGPFDLRYRISMDYDLWLKLAKRRPPVILERELAAFRMTEGTLSMSGFERQFAEHEEQLRLHGNGHRLAVAGGIAMSRLIVLSYRGLRWLRTRSAQPA